MPLEISIEINYPDLLDGYKNLFAADLRIASGYQAALFEKIKLLLRKHEMKNLII